MATNPQKRYIHCIHFEQANSRAKTNDILTLLSMFTDMRVTDDDVSFCEGPGMLTFKTTKQVHNSM